MTDLLAIAGATRSGGSYTTFTLLDKFEQYHDGADNFTRALALRDSDSACVVVFVKGNHDDIVDTLNTRARLTHERAAATAGLAELAEMYAVDGKPVDAPADDADAIAYRATIAECDALLDSLPRVKTQLTLHAVRAFAHYNRVQQSASEPLAVPVGAADPEQEQE